MNPLSASNQDVRPEGPLHSGLSATAESHALYLRTTPAERFLLLATVLILPLEAHIPPVAGFSSLFLIFAMLAAYVAVNRLGCLNRIWMHPVFVAAYGFTGVSLAMEFVSPLSSYVVIGRFTLMIAGALLVASLCRDRLALKMLLYGYIAAALWLGVLLFLSSYGSLSGVAAEDFDEASQVRAETFRDTPIKGNLNVFAIHCVQGGVVALAFALGSASVRGRSFFAAIGILCLVASSLPMSRGAILNALVSCTVMLKAYGIRQGKPWLLAGLLAISAVLLVPDAIWSRMAFMTAKGHKESREIFYESALRHIDDYWVTGVGAGNYFQKWGFENGFGHVNGLNYTVYGVHNAFLQVLMYWGLIALLAFLALVWLGYRCLPRIYRNDSLALGILGIAVSLLLALPFASEFYYKGFSLGLGMLVAYQHWLAPRDAVQVARR